MAKIIMVNGGLQ